MKALSVKPKWAEMITSGRKTIEVSTWPTLYRGDLLICASKPLGMALCVVRLVECRPMLPGDAEAAGCEWEPDTYAWVLSDIRPVNRFQVRGRLGLYEVQMPGDATA